jgi:hypothetical protein
MGVVRLTVLREPKCRDLSAAQHPGRPVVTNIAWPPRRSDSLRNGHGKVERLADGLKPVFLRTQLDSSVVSSC